MWPNAIVLLILFLFGNAPHKRCSTSFGHHNVSLNTVAAHVDVLKMRKLGSDLADTILGAGNDAFFKSFAISKSPMWLDLNKDAVCPWPDASWS
jgi:hypothetical protein